MPDVSINQLPPAGPLTGNEQIPVTQFGNTVRTSTGAIAAQLSGVGTVTQVNAGYGLTGGPITTTGTLSIATTGVTAGSYGAQSSVLSFEVTPTGQLTGAISAIPILIDNTQVTGLGTMSTQDANNVNITGGTIDGVDITYASIHASGTVTFDSYNGYLYSDGVNGLIASSTIPWSAISSTPTTLAGYGITDAVPSTRRVNTSTGLQGGNNLSNDITLSLTDTAVTPGVYGSPGYYPAITVDQQGRVTQAQTIPLGTGGTVIEVDTGTGLTGGPITTTGTISIANTGVTAGAYNYASVTVNAQGQITSASSGTPVVSVSGTSGRVNSTGGQNPVIDLAASGVVNGSYTNVNLTVDSYGRITTISSGNADTTFSGGTTGLTPNTPTAGDVVLGGILNVSNGGTGASSLTGYLVGNGTSAFTAVSTIPNAGLTNSSITINGNTVSLGGSTTISAQTISPLTIGTGLSGTSFNGSSPVTITIDSTVATLTGIQTLTNKTITEPLFLNTWQLNGAGVTSYTPFSSAVASIAVDDNAYQEIYGVNLNNGSDASFDFVAYNDASDINSYFIDMGINSSNFSSLDYPIFTPNSAYLFTGGGTSGQQTDLFIGTSNSASDVIFFTGDVQTANIRATITGNTGNFLIGTSTDDGVNLLQVAGNITSEGASFTAPVTTSSTSAPANNEFVTKAYVDNASSTGIHIHTAVYAETSADLSSTAGYTQGGTTFNITDVLSSTTIQTSVAHGLSIDDEIWLTTTAGNGLSTNTAYFVYSTPASNQLTLSATYGGVQINTLTTASGLSYATRANSGVGAYLESTANAQFTIAGVSPAPTTGDRILVYQQTNGAWNGVYTITNLGASGGGGSKWKLTRATDQNQYAPANTAGMGGGDYFLVTSNSESYVLTTEGSIIIGYTPITYTLFSSAPSYTGGTNINVSSGVISLTGTVAATNGGTGVNTVTTGDLLYGSGTNTWSSLPLGIAYKSLVVNASGTQVEWNAVALNQATAVSGQLGATNGGTGQSAVTTGDLLYGTGTNTWGKLAAGAAYKSLTMDSSGTNVAWSAVALNQSAAVTGTLGAVNGGTGLSSYTLGDLIYSSATNTLLALAGNTSTTKKFLSQTGTGSASAAPSWETVQFSDLVGTVPITSGGTGATTVSGAQTNLQVDPAGTAVAMAIALG